MKKIKKVPTKNSKKKINWKAIILVILALQQIIVPYFILSDSGNLMDGVNQTEIVPAGYAFGIWGLIYTLALVFPAIYLFKNFKKVNKNSKKDNGSKIINAVFGTVCLTYLGSTVWLYFAESSQDWLTLPIIIIMWLLTVYSVQEFTKVETEILESSDNLSPQSGKSKSSSKNKLPKLSWKEQIAKFSLSSYCGWLSVAFAANFVEIFNSYDIYFYGLTTADMSIFFLVFAGILAISNIVKFKGNLYFVATLIWGISSIIVGNLIRDNQSINVIDICIVLLIAIVFTGIVVQMRKRQNILN